MKAHIKYVECLAWLAAMTLPAHAEVTILSVTPLLSSPQPIGTSVTWTVAATDTNPGPLAFQFNVASPQGPLALAQDFNLGTLASGAWSAPPFVWTPILSEGTYSIQVITKDFTTGETGSETVMFDVVPLVTGPTPVVVATANPLVALFSSPSCSAGNTMRVQFRPQIQMTPWTATNWVNCHPPYSMNFEIAGMYPQTAYAMRAETNTGIQIIDGEVITFTTGTIPASIPLPAFTVPTPAGPWTDTTDSVLLLSTSQGAGLLYPDIATDLSGNIIWYYYPSSTLNSLLTRPLKGGTMLVISDGQAWNPVSEGKQLLHEVDLAGNVIRETNIGILQQQLLAKGAQAGPCSAVPSPAPIGAACLGAFHHDDIRTLPNEQTAVLVDIERIFPPGTQGDTSGLPVDIIGDMIVVLDKNWQVVWYFDTFQHAGGPPELNIDRTAVLGETCGANSRGCPPALLLGPGIAPLAHDWLHANSLYYWPQTNDIIWSSRNQDWVMRIDYQDGYGTGNILWRMGREGDFTFNNINNEAFPWFSHQHDAAMENNGAGPLTLFDNGDTRVSMLGYGNSRGMALTVDEEESEVTPVLTSDLGVYSTAMGSAQLLSDGNYFFLAGIVVVSLDVVDSYSLELFPTPESSKQVLNIQGPEAYRGWRMPSLYAPPIT